MKRIELVLCVLLLALGVSSCSNMDELYKDYLTGSIYSGKVSDLTATAGNERVLLQWTNPKDQISKRIKVVYGEPEEVIETESLVDELYIENLSMGSYEFTVYTMDEYGNLSIPVSITKSIFTASMIDGIDPPRCTATLQEDGKYTIHFTGVSGAMGMFGGDLEFTITGDGFTYSDSYTVEVDYTTYKSSIVDLAFEDVELPGSGNYTLSYKLSVYPASLKDKTTSGVINYTEVSMDTTEISGEVALTLKVRLFPVPAYFGARVFFCPCRAFTATSFPLSLFPTPYLILLSGLRISSGSDRIHIIIFLLTRVQTYVP